VKRSLHSRRALRKTVVTSAKLLQLRVFRPGFFQDRKIGVGILPEGKEILVGGAALLGIALERIGAGQP